MSAFSPGPWKWRGMDLVDANGVLVLATHTCAADWLPSEPNRRLIAAALEMHELLQNVPAHPDPDEEWESKVFAVLARIDGAP